MAQAKAQIQNEGEGDADTRDGESGEIAASTDDEIEVNLGKRKESDDLNETKNEKPEMPKSRFMSEVLPKLPRIRNGMRLLGIHEQSPLIDSGELYKMRVFRPDKPIASSEVFEDGTRMRFTNLSKIVSDDFIISRFKIEMVTCKVGLADSDTLGTNAVKGVFEAEDACNLTMKPFLEKKMKGKTSKVYELTNY